MADSGHRPVRLVVIGGGRMGEALVGGLLAAGAYEAADVVVVEKVAARRETLTAADGIGGRHPGLRIVDMPVAGEGAILAVKPTDAEAACRALTAASAAAGAPADAPAGAGPRRVLSIMAGVTIANLENWLTPEGGRPPAVVRAMPNTPALIGAGASAVAGGSGAGTADLAWARQILESVGIVTEVPEGLLDAVTGLSGSGPAYVFLFAEALIEAGVFVGLPRATAKELAVQTLVGSARLLAETGESPESLRAGVTSPGGTTAAGLRALEAAAVRNAILDAVAAATERSRQLGA